MDKSKAKVFYEAAGLATPPSVTLRDKDERSADDLVAELGERCVVKPAAEGSALGVFIVEGSDAVSQALEQVFAYDDEVLVERFVSGTELTVAVIGNEDPQALPIIEIVPQGVFYDYESKYAPGGSQHLCPAPLSEAVTAQVQDMAVRAHQALECAGVSRSDFILDEEGTCWILETNTIPGMTGTSLLPDAARAAGISFAELCKLLSATRWRSNPGDCRSADGAGARSRFRRSLFDRWCRVGLCTRTVTRIARGKRSCGPAFP